MGGAHPQRGLRAGAPRRLAGAVARGHRRLGSAGALALLLTACSAGGSGGGGVAHNHGTPSIPAADGLPRMVVPADNPYTEAKFELGRALFHDTRLSGNGTQSCASCHEQARAFTDGRPLAIGSTGQTHPRNAQPLANAAFHATLTWANPTLVTLEHQMEVPLFGTDPVELGITDANMPEVLGRFAADAKYVELFAAAFGGGSGQITIGNIIKAIATFERGLTSADSRYDRYLAGKAVLTESETRGMQLFMGEKAECFHCHGSFNFNDHIRYVGQGRVETPFHNTGLYNMGGTGAFPYPNRGLFEFTAQAADMGAFRAASLRNVALTAPYMHDGSIAALEEVLDFYAAGGRNVTNGPLAGDGRRNPYKSDLIGNISLTAQDKTDLVAFLRTLTDDTLVTSARFAKPSWLP
ncbi:methanobactin export MATE transporter MbnM [Derxia gummosa]|uniref:Methanobactin export MATE transporter MbnM n=1 Tax=Derxia gummosa DSM 723 TaxID=1121388 RepID=A0A8B6XBA6_9BURK|nr:methanobactin export MATE transporter MbnM [Derxia gummosa]